MFDRTTACVTTSHTCLTHSGVFGVRLNLSVVLTCCPPLSPAFPQVLGWRSGAVLILWFLVSSSSFKFLLFFDSQCSLSVFWTAEVYVHTMFTIFICPLVCTLVPGIWLLVGLHPHLEFDSLSHNFNNFYSMLFNSDDLYSNVLWCQTLL